MFKLKFLLIFLFLYIIYSCANEGKLIYNRVTSSIDKNNSEPLFLEMPTITDVLSNGFTLEFFANGMYGTYLYVSTNSFPANQANLLLYILSNVDTEQNLGPSEVIASTNLSTQRFITNFIDSSIQSGTTYNIGVVLVNNGNNFSSVVTRRITTPTQFHAQGLFFLVAPYVTVINSGSGFVNFVATEDSTLIYLISTSMNDSESSVIASGISLFARANDSILFNINNLQPNTRYYVSTVLRPNVDSSSDRNIFEQIIVDTPPVERIRINVDDLRIRRIFSGGFEAQYSLSGPGQVFFLLNQDNNVTTNDILSLNNGSFRSITDDSLEIISFGALSQDENDALALTEGANYYLHILARDSVNINNISGIHTLSVRVRDAVAPEIESFNIPPDSITASAFDFSFSVNEDVMVDIFVSLNFNEPDVNIKNGRTVSLDANTLLSSNVTGLELGRTYYVHFILTDNNQNITRERRSVGLENNSPPEFVDLFSPKVTEIGSRNLAISFIPNKVVDAFLFLSLSTNTNSMGNLNIVDQNDFVQNIINSIPSIELSPLLFTTNFTGLIPGTSYDIFVLLRDEDGRTNNIFPDSSIPLQQSTLIE